MTKDPNYEYCPRCGTILEEDDYEYPEYYLCSNCGYSKEILKKTTEKEI